MRDVVGVMSSKRNLNTLLAGETGKSEFLFRYIILVTDQYANTFSRNV